MSTSIIMSKIITLSTVMALAMSTPLLQANNVPMLRAMPANLAPAIPAQGNCDMMASNTVTASFVGLRDLAVQRIDQAEPSTVQVAVFQVIDSLGYRKFNYIGDGRLTPGMQFTIAMNKELPGQPSENVDTIASLQPGDQVVMRVDHLYLITGQEGESIRVCARLMRRDAAPQQPQAPQLTPAQSPLSGAAAQPGIGGPTMHMSARTFSMSADSTGQMHTVQTSRIYDPNTGEIRTRMLINGVEVDPDTRQPLNQMKITPVQLPEEQPAQTPAPAEHAPAAPPATEDAPVQSAAPQPGQLDASESF